MRIGWRTVPSAWHWACRPEARHEPRRMVLLDAMSWLAETGAATAKTAPRPVMSAIALANLIISPPSTSPALPAEPALPAMLRPGTENGKGNSRIATRRPPAESAGEGLATTPSRGVPMARALGLSHRSQAEAVSVCSASRRQVPANKIMLKISRFVLHVSYLA